MEEKIIYFERPGKKNTVRVIELVKERARAKGIKKIEAGEKVIAVAGAGAGADTAIVAMASPSTRMAGLHVYEILCKPL